MNDERLRTLRRWFSISWTELDDFINEQFCVLDTESVQHRLLADLQTCPASTPAQFREWAKNQVKGYANDSRLFDFASVRTIQDVLDLAACRPVDPDTKPLVYEPHGPRVFIQLHDADGKALTWKIPASWFPIAKALWPCHVRHMPNGRPYVSKKSKRQKQNGDWTQRDAPVHSLFVNAPVGAKVDALDGDYLNYCDGNLRVHDPLPATKQALERSLNTATVSADWTPAKATRTPKPRDGNRLNRHESQVLKWLRGEI
jgi:hypothetical protein